MRLEFSRQIEAREDRANFPGSQLSDATRNLTSLQQKYDLLSKEAMNHWQDIHGCQSPSDPSCEG